MTLCAHTFGIWGGAPSQQVITSNSPALLRRKRQSSGAAVVLFGDVGTGIHQHSHKAQLAQLSKGIHMGSNSIAAAQTRLRMGIRKKHGTHAMQSATSPSTGFKLIDSSYSAMERLALRKRCDVQGITNTQRQRSVASALLPSFHSYHAGHNQGAVSSLTDGERASISADCLARFKLLTLAHVISGFPFRMPSSPVPIDTAPRIT